MPTEQDNNLPICISYYCAYVWILSSYCQW